jgi:hypothetical protein
MLIFNLNNMKKIFLLGMFAILSTTFISCSADDDESTTNLKTTAQIDGQSGQTPIPPPKP